METIETSTQIQEEVIIEISLDKKVTYAQVLDVSKNC